MSSRYRVEYHLKSHRRDGFVEWIKGLLAAPFVLNAVSNELDDEVTSQRVRSQYAQIFKDIERLICNKIAFDNENQELERTSDSISKRPLSGKSRLNQLVPTIGSFFTELRLEKAFLWEDKHSAISDRRMVAPSFNDVRRILNTAQILYYKDYKREHNHDLLRMVTFDGDVTLYNDGGSLSYTSPVIPCLITLLEKNIYVAIVTAAGYDEAHKYEKRLGGLITAVHDSTSLTLTQKSHLTVMGGESNYLFQYYECDVNEFGLKSLPQNEWLLSYMKSWEDQYIEQTLDFAQKIFRALKDKLRLPPEVSIIRKRRAVGIVQGEKFDLATEREIPVKLLREQLEEIVLTLQSALEIFPPARQIQFSCFDGGSDVWCDIGGKDLGIRILQNFYDPANPVKACETLHVGDQFAPVGSANDFKARLAGCTLWIASPEETVQNLHKLLWD